MPSDIKKFGPSARLLSAPSSASLPSTLADTTAGHPDAGLSAAFRHALGTGTGQPHLPASSLKTGQEIARQARADRPAAPAKGSPRKAHIGPRSGHK